MFTGLVEEVGLLTSFARHGTSARASIRTTLGASSPLVLGESIAVNGVCLTVDAITSHGFEADVSVESMARSTLGTLVVPARVNLERAVPLGGRMGGHSVLGHVDATITLISVEMESGARRTTFEAPADIAPFLAKKGSITIDGVSLTINDVSDLDSGKTRFSVMLVPHTLGRTTLLDLPIGGRANVEVDVLARYVHRQLTLHAGGQSAAQPPKDEASLLEKLRSGGYM